jgi:hypothetical protein
LHIEELHRGDCVERIFLTVDQPALQRCVKLAEIDRDRGGANRGELLDQDLGIDDPEFLPAQRR